MGDIVQYIVTIVLGQKLQEVPAPAAHALLFISEGKLNSVSFLNSL